MTKVIGFPTRETNSSHASSSQGPAQRQTTSFRDKAEYRVDLVVLDILLFPVKVAGTVGAPEALPNRKPYHAGLSAKIE